jgi:hypothetical protein
MATETQYRWVGEADRDDGETCRERGPWATRDTAVVGGLAEATEAAASGHPYDRMVMESRVVTYGEITRGPLTLAENTEGR